MTNKNNNDLPENGLMVSICCLTYNHVDYVGQMLDSLTSQVTDYSFEILIHDDASIDGTQKIIEAYVKKYPKIIKPIYQVENQLSQSIFQSINGKFNVARAQGRYLLFCEGDDYWCDNSKLDRQIKLIEQYGADLVFHAYYEVNGKTIDIKRPFGSKERKVSFWELRRKTPNSAPLATLCLRTAALRTLNDLVPDFLEIYMSHSTTQVAGFLCSKAIYDPKPMSAYRKGVPQSWTQRTNADKNLRKLYVQRYRAAYKALLPIVPINVATPIRLSLIRLSFMDVIRSLKKFLQVKKF